MRSGNQLTQQELPLQSLMGTTPAIRQVHSLTVLCEPLICKGKQKQQWLT